MKLSIIPAPYEIEYLQGFTKTTAPVTEYEENGLPEDGFVLHINGDIRIGASSPSGFFYGRQALSQIKFQCGQNIPDVRIKDIPRYKYRSFMIDSVRHFTDIDDIKKMIDYCAKLRFNVFHWHLTDDQGWRAEIKAFPVLTQQGAYRNGSHFGAEQNEEVYGGFYTQEEMRDIVNYAHENHMIVVPEIDMPGHVSALLNSIPSLVCGNKTVEIKTEAGIFKDVICAGNDENYDILYEILDEICDIFPDTYIHIGGDEAPKAQWKECPVCRQRMERENLSDEDELQGYFINRVNRYLKSKGKKVITWNESLKGGNLDEDIIVQMWMDPKGLSRKSPNAIINSDFYHYYTDYPYSMTPLKKTYKYETDINRNVTGVDTPIWTEYVPDRKKMEYMCFPRFIAVSQTAWCKNKPSYSHFREALAELIKWYGFAYDFNDNEWDPPGVTRLPDVVKHFGSISKNERIREFFLKNKFNLRR